MRAHNRSIKDGASRRQLIAPSRQLFRTAILAALVCPIAQAQTSPSLLVSRAELVAAANNAQLSATKGDYDERARNAMLAAAIRQRLRDGDFQVGDRVVVTIVTDVPRRDTVVVRSGRVLEIPGLIAVPLAGILRSELQERVATEVLKYVKAQRVEVTALVRMGVLGAVMRPGYFAFASDLPISDAIMGAGGPALTADVERSTVRRGNQLYRSPNETRRAIAAGLTLDQFGITAGDELVVGQRHEFSPSTLIGMAGGVASIFALLIAIQRR